MPRSEKPLDPLAGPVAAFAHDLRMLREKAGRPPYRVLAKRAGFAASTLSVAASANVLPSLDVTLAYVQACGGEPDPWRERWHALAARVVRDDAGTEPNRVPFGVGVGVGAGVGVGEGAGVGMGAGGPVSVLGTALVGVAESNKATSRGARRRSASLVVRLVVILLVAAITAVITRQVTSHRPQFPEAGRLQMDELYKVIRQGQSVASDAGASADLVAGRERPGDQELLATAMAVRTDQAAQVQRLDLSQTPDVQQIAKALHDFWSDRAEADMLYAVSAGNRGASGPTSGMTRAAFTDLESDAQQAGSEAAYLWNEDAPALGLPQISESTL